MDKTPEQHAIDQWLQKRADNQWDPGMRGPGDFYYVKGTQYTSDWIEIVNDRMYGITRTFVPSGENFVAEDLGAPMYDSPQCWPEETEFDLIITAVNDIVPGMKALRQITGLNLGETKRIFDQARVKQPVKIKFGIALLDAQAYKKILQEAGVYSEIKNAR